MTAVDNTCSMHGSNSLLNPFVSRCQRTIRLKIAVTVASAKWSMFNVLKWRMNRPAKKYWQNESSHSGILVCQLTEEMVIWVQILEGDNIYNLSLLFWVGICIVLVQTCNMLCVYSGLAIMRSFIQLNSIVWLVCCPKIFDKSLILVQL